MTARLTLSIGVVLALGCNDGPAAPPNLDVNMTIDAVDVTQYWFPLTGSVYNSCPPVPESVLITGTVHIVSKVRDGSASWYTNWVDVKGVGETSGTSYVVRDNYHQRTESDQSGGFIQEFEEHLRIVSLGSDENNQLVVKGTFTSPPPTIVFDRMSIQCRG